MEPVLLTLAKLAEVHSAHVTCVAQPLSVAVTNNMLLAAVTATFVGSHVHTIIPIP